MKNKTGWSLLIAALLSACGSLPQTPTEFRQGLQDNAKNDGISIDKFEVALPYAQVTNLLKRNTNKCLNVTIVKSGRDTNGFMQHIPNQYESFATISNKTAEIYSTRTTPGLKLFLVLADLHPISSTRTKVELYYYTSMFGQYGKAYKLWATGQDVGCPDYL